MDKIQVLFLDKDAQYRNTITMLLTRSLPQMCFYEPDFYCNDGSTEESTETRQSSLCDLSLLPITFNQTILFFNPSEYWNPPSHSYSILLTDGARSSNNHSEQYSIYRYAPVCDFVLLLEEYLNDHPILTENLHQKNICCIAGQSCITVRRNKILGLASEKVREGYVPVVLEICPRHECVFAPSSAGDGNTLSDAMLRLMADDLQMNDFGTFLYPVEPHLLVFRPFECTDDIFECSPDHIRQLVEIIRQWNEHTAYSHYIIISCHAIPFSFIYKTAVLCDNLIIMNMSSKEFNASEFNKELSALMANLPDSCPVTRIECDCSRQGGDAIHAS